MSAIVSDTPPHERNADTAYATNSFMLPPSVRPEVKSEPPEDAANAQMNGNNHHGALKASKSPAITLTPTMKLLASPNPLDPKRKFPCPYENCTKSYGKSSHLRSHLTWHTGIKPYACKEPNCGKSFTRSDELNRHSRTHTGEKPFECMQCAKKFSRSDHLTKHVATHTKQMQTLKRACPVVNPEPPSSVASAQKKALTELTEMSAPEHGMNYNDGMHFMASLLECAQFKEGRHVIEPESIADESELGVHMPIKIKLERPDSSDEYKVVNNSAEAKMLLMKREATPSAADMVNAIAERQHHHASTMMMSAAAMATSTATPPIPTMATTKMTTTPLMAATTAAAEAASAAAAAAAAANVEATQVAASVSALASASASASSSIPATATTTTTAVAATTTTTPSGATSSEYHRNDAGAGEDNGNSTRDDSTIMPEANAPPLPQAGAPFAVPRFGLFEEELDIDIDRPYRCNECTKCFKRQDDLNRHFVH